MKIKIIKILAISVLAIAGEAIVRYSATLWGPEAAYQIMTPIIIMTIIIGYTILSRR